MEKPTSPATQLTEAPPPPATSSLPAKDPPLPTSADQRSADLPPVAKAQPPSTVATDPSPRGRKRALEANLQIENSNYYKMRLLLKDLRPHVLEVIRTPDFSNCKAAFEIQAKMKLMLQLYQEMIGGESPKREKTAKSESLSNGKAINETPQITTTSTTALSSSETNSLQSEKLNTHGDGDKVVGGSAFGWNFTTGGGTDPVYCGMSKEEYRSSHPITQPEAEAEVELQNTL
ncbi:hypothetical protein CARUB_v10010200mg [Capsella rubella]|uniref:Uncharacterized protein n=1 Tax=Capsella rubella TaxID=81985 RepID=R0GMU1_9BRAS|nr:uncharacterized protein LOC17897160 [Capsella rubella]EOA37071.1 hypothetical protein CARUB_v10010200mg [Capsella rubella]